jgi:hypothetical protein
MLFIGGKFLDNEAFPQSGVEVTMKKLDKIDIENPRTFKPEKKDVLYLHEFEQPLILGAKANRKSILKKMEGKNTKSVDGVKITLYRDPTVKFGGKAIGAIRIK